MRHTALLVAFAVVVGASPARAQDPEKPVTVQIGGGYTWTLSDVRDYLGDGYNFNIGITWEATRAIGLEGVYSFNGLGSKDFSLPVSATPVAGGVPTPFTADMNMQYGTGNVIFQVPEGNIRPYGLVGMGVYHRPIKVTTPGVGFAPGYCDPWLYVCFPGGWVPVENIVGERSSTDFGMDFGGGVRFGPIYAEIRYHYIWGPKIEAVEIPSQPIVTTPPPTGSLAGKNANGQFLATTFGIRF